MANSWSGIVVKPDTENGIVFVSGQWTVPHVNASSGDSSCYIWIGIDGYGDGYQYVLQAGISLEVKKGRLTPNAWWEWTPDQVRPLPLGSFAVLAGDVISCKIEGQLRSSTAIITLQNHRTNQVANFPNPVRAQSRVSLRGNYAEWIVEAAIENSQSKLCNYGQVQFSECVALDSTSGNTLDPFGGIALNLEQNGQVVSYGSSSGPGQVICSQDPATVASTVAPNAIAARALLASSITSREIGSNIS
jgi:hypothetical protein